jgi:P pilus assembly chaperone PapD
MGPVRAVVSRHRGARRAVGLLAALLVSGTAPRTARAQLSVDQVEVFLDPHAPGRGAASFNVSNESDQVVEVAVYVNDWDRDQDGEHRFLPSGRLPHSCGPYLRVFPLSLRLAGRSSQAVRVALQGADSLTAACWSIVFVETAATPQATGRQVTYITRLGVKVYVIPPGLPRTGEITEVQVRSAARRPPAAGSGRELVVRFHNTGGVPLWPHGRAEFRRLDNSVAASADIPEFPVLPGAVRRVTVAVPALPRGRYVALALVDYGGAEIAGGQAELEVP